MSVKLFGQFLVDEGLINLRHLKDVQDHTYYVHRTVGELAVKHGLLSREQCEQVAARQEGVDRFFGELCIEAGLLTLVQLDQLLEEQGRQHSRVGEILIELGHLRPAELESALLRYRADQARFRAPSELPEPLRGSAAAALLELFPRLVRRAGGLYARVGGLVPWSGPLAAPVAQAVRLGGPAPLVVGIGSEARFAASLLRLARGSVEPEVPEPELQRALAQFVQRLARQLDPGACGPEGVSLPQSGFACAFISTRGDGCLIFAREPG